MTLHFADTRRQAGLRYLNINPREDGTGYNGQVNQYPVICAADIVEEQVAQGSRPSVTTVQSCVTCPDCKERLS